MAESKLDILEQRLEDLEQRLFGAADKDISYPKDAPEVIDTLAKVNSQINAVTAGRPKVEAALKRLNELEMYLDPAYAEALTLSKDAKIEIIMAEEDVLREQAQNLERVKDMCDVLSSEHIKAVPALEGKLQELSKVHLQQQDSASQLTEAEKNLLQQYNSIVTLLSKQFVQWDQLLTKMEMAQNTKSAD